MPYALTAGVADTSTAGEYAAGVGSNVNQFVNVGQSGTIDEVIDIGFRPRIIVLMGDAQNNGDGGVARGARSALLEHPIPSQPWPVLTRRHARARRSGLSGSKRGCAR